MQSKSLTALLRKILVPALLFLLLALTAPANATKKSKTLDKMSKTNKTKQGKPDEVQVEQISCESKFGSAPYATGNSIVVCVNFFPTFVKHRVILNVGQTATVHAKYFWKVFEESDIDVILQIANTKIYTSLRPYNRPKQDLCFPFVAVIISMNMGWIIDISLRSMSDVCMDSAVETKILTKLIKNSNLLYSGLLVDVVICYYKGWLESLFGVDEMLWGNSGGLVKHNIVR